MGKVIKMGIAQRVLDNRREGRKLMNITLSRKALEMLDMIIRQPQRLPFTDMEKPIKAYSANDTTGQEQIVALQKWLETKVLKKVIIQKMQEKDEIPEVAKYVVPASYEGSTVGLAKIYVKRLKEVMEHYQDMGKLTLMCEMYLELKFALEGKKMDVDDPTVELDADETVEEEDN